MGKNKVDQVNVTVLNKFRHEMMIKKIYKSIDEYIADSEEPITSKLIQMRKIIGEVAPEAVETISYNMPAFRLKKVLAYFAGFKNHIGLYAMPTTNDAFKKELANYKTGKGSIQFPLDKELPVELIKQIIEFRLSEIQWK